MSTPPVTKIPPDPVWPRDEPRDRIKLSLIAIRFPGLADERNLFRTWRQSTQETHVEFLRVRHVPVITVDREVLSLPQHLPTRIRSPRK
jgi:hypothetical protein